jgi:hypothetical protein
MPRVDSSNQGAALAVGENEGGWPSAPSGPKPVGIDPQIRSLKARRPGASSGVRRFQRRTAEDRSMYFIDGEALRDQARRMMV